MSDTARRLIADQDNGLWLSAASVWELGTKHALGRLPLRAPFQRIMLDGARAEGLGLLDVSAAHAAEAAQLPPLHSDPFDRMLVAQARLECRTVVTRDPDIRRYDVDTAW